MLIPIKQNQISKLIPSVGTGSQFKYALGDPRKILQRLIISSIGGVLNLLLFISQSSTQTENLWLILCVIFFLYIIWGPILESSRKNTNYKLSLIHISEPTRQEAISYAVFCLKKKELGLLLNWRMKMGI